MGRKKWYLFVEEMESDLDKYLEGYNRRRPHQGRRMHARAAYDIFTAGTPPANTLERKPRSGDRNAAPSDLISPWRPTAKRIPLLYNSCVNTFKEMPVNGLSEIC